MELPNNNLIIFDKGPKAPSRYTIIIGKDVYVMSSEPRGENGINEHVGHTRNLNVSTLGKQVSLIQVPRSVRLAIARKLLTQFGGRESVDR